MYFRYEVPQSAIENSKDILGDIGRLGSLSLVIFSLITFISSVVLPFGVLSPQNKKSSFAPRFPLSTILLLKKVAFMRPDLQTAWMMSHVMFALTMVFAPLTRSLRFATFLVAICGIPWAVSGWAPFAFMGVEINRLAADTSSRIRTTPIITPASSNRHSAYLPLEGLDTNIDIDLDRVPSILRLYHRRDGDSDSDSDADDNETSSTGELAGIYLGVLNVYTTLPQFVGTFISWIVFSLLEPRKLTPSDRAKEDTVTDKQTDGKWVYLSRDGPDAIAVCLFIGALSALVAAEATRRLRYVW
jgi:solute carrier family 45 protein 1/2/4